MRRPGPAIQIAVVLGFALLSPIVVRTGQTSPPQTPTQRSTESEQLDLNTATIAELKALPGMGAVYARRIVENRPYSAKNQLVTRGVLPQAVYDGMRDRIVAHRVRSPQ